MIDMADAKKKYDLHRFDATNRGIKWEFTFETWVEWWGDDFYNRGRGYDQLQMQRKLDAGPYSPSNTIKGTPKENWKTRSAVRQNKESLRTSRRYSMVTDIKPREEKPDTLDIRSDRRKEIDEIFDSYPNKFLYGC